MAQLDGVYAPSALWPRFSCRSMFFMFPAQKATGREIKGRNHKKQSGHYEICTYLSLSPRLQVLDELQQSRVGQAIQHRKKVADHQVLQAHAAIQAQLPLEKKKITEVECCIRFAQRLHGRESHFRLDSVKRRYCRGMYGTRNGFSWKSRRRPLRGYVRFVQTTLIGKPVPLFGVYFFNWPIDAWYAVLR